MSMVNDQADIQDEYQPYVDESDDPTRNEYAGGSTPESLSLPDESPRIELVDQVASQLRQEVDRERKFIAAYDQQTVFANTNESGDVSFQRYGVTSTSTVQIAREKRRRGDMVITNYTDGVTLYIGKQPGVIVGGTDTVAIVGSAQGASRVIRTRLALWAIASAPCNIDVQEEFD